jgi:hypothetical protein
MLTGRIVVTSFTSVLPLVSTLSGEYAAQGDGAG